MKSIGTEPAAAWRAPREFGLDRLGRIVRQIKVYRATIAELKKLSDRDLADLGLRRDMIRHLARDAARRA